MKNRLVIAAFCCLVMAGNSAIAQNVSRCATDEILHNAIDKNPQLKAAYELYELDVQNRTNLLNQQQANSANKTTSTYNIPVVFHVILTQSQIDQINGTSGIYSRVTSQIAVLNVDFNALNTETIPAAFLPLKGNPNISFGLAHTKPDGTGTIGIEIKVAAPGFAGFAVGDGSAKKTALGGLDAWDYTKYLNIWITDITSGSGGGEILGYAFNPKLASSVYGDPSLMGVVVDYLAFGKRANISHQYYPNADKGRTMVHELGHFFTLNHIWGNTAVGNGNCNDDDGVDDTPKQSDANQSVCPTYPKLPNCNNTAEGQMFMNYMDYVTDVCMSMFSKGQVTRMQSEFATGGGSVNLPKNGLLFNWPTGIENVNTLKYIDIVPNPSNGLFTITHSEMLKNIVIVNMVGQPVKQISGSTQQSGTISVDITDVTKGVYMVQCQFEEGIVSRKIVIQ